MQKDKMPEYVCEFLKNEDEYTFKHSSRVADVARAIGKTMQLCSADMELLDEASRLHDVGKIRVDESILNKPGRLTEEEFSEIKKHAGYGYAIVNPKNSVVAKCRSVASRKDMTAMDIRMGFPEPTSRYLQGLLRSRIRWTLWLQTAATGKHDTTGLYALKEIDKNAGKDV